MTNIKIIVAALLSAGLFACGFYVAWSIQAGSVELSKSQLTECQIVNKSSSDIISKLKSESTSLNNNCKDRLAGKDLFIKKLQDIDSMGTSREQNKDPNVDSVLNALNRLYSSPGN